MGSHILDILRQGIWASLTGGWFYDPHLGLFSNTFHLYVWLFLLALPLILHLTLPANFIIWMIYCIVIGVLFVIVKFFNYKLHHMFDTEEVIEEGTLDKNGNSNVDLGSQEPPEVIEMTDMSNSNKESAGIDTKKDSQHSQHSDHNVVRPAIEMGVKRRRSKRDDKIQRADSKSKRAPLAEMDKDDIDIMLQGAVGGTSKSLTRCHSHTDQEDDTVSDIDDNLSVPNTITTKADVEVEPSDCHISLPDDPVEHEVKSPTESKHSCDADLSDVSPEHVYPKVKRARRKPQRAKSALESSELPSTHSSEKSLQSQPSLPARPKLHSVINKDTGVSIIRPWSDQTISRTKEMLESDEITVIDFAAMNNVAKTYRTREASTKSKLADSIDESTEKEVVRWERTMQDDDKDKQKKLENNGKESKQRESSQNRSSVRVIPIDDESCKTGDNKDNHRTSERSNKNISSNRKERSKLRTRKAASEDRQQTNKEKNLKSDTRKAASEERHLDMEESLVVSASEPVIKVGCSGLHSDSDDSDLSLGEVVVSHKPRAKTTDKHKNNHNTVTGIPTDKPKCKVKTRSKSDRVRKERPNSFELMQKKGSSNSHGNNDTMKNRPKIHSSPTLVTTDTQNGNPVHLKPKDIGFSRVTKMLARAASDSSKRSSNDWNPTATSSQQSSTVGLDWLFSTDSDSSDTRSHIEHDENSMTSGSVSLDDSMYDMSMEDAGCRQARQELPETDTSPSSPSTDELEVMRKQGAIPKHFHKPLPPLPEPSQSKEDSPDTKASSPASFDLSDPDDFHRKLLEILNEPAENSKEKLKKFMVALEAKKNKSSSVKSKSEKQDDEPVAGGSKDVTDKDMKVDELDTKSNSSKPVTPTEISTLLPDTEEAENRVVKRLARKPVRKRRAATSERNRDPVTPNLGDNSHLAENYEDTTEGATHLFVDKDGNWFSYTFGDVGTGTAVSVGGNQEQKKETAEDRWSSSSCASGSMVMLDLWKMKDEEKPAPGPLVLDSYHDMGLAGNRDSPPPFGILKAYVDQLLDNGRRFDMSSDDDSKDISSGRDTPQPKHFYKFKLLPKKFLKIYFDRLALLALLDRNLSVIENIIAVIMSVMVGALGALVLAGNFYYDFWIFVFCFITAGCQNLSVIENIIAVIMSVMVGALGALVLAGNFYYDFWIFVFCFIMAGCQYSLLKSVQPDAASPMHGYNHLIVFSRPFYFCFLCGLMLLMDHLSGIAITNTVYVYGIPFTTTSALIFAREFLKVFLLCLPLTFTVGLLPQVNTYVMYVLEQIDTHVFGGNATVSLLSSVYCVIRSVLAAGFLYVICYLTLVQLGKNIVDEPNPCENKEFAQTAAFSIFCAVLVAMSYHLSRSASDHTVLWMLIKDKLFGVKDYSSEEETSTDLKDPLPGKLKNCVGKDKLFGVKDDFSEEETSTDLKDPLPGKLKNCVNERLQSDLLISVVIMILSFAIHVSTVFIQPYIDEILYFTVAGFGFLVHYMIPQLRKEMPWLCCSHPMLKSQERNMYEATGPAKIMWFEKFYIWMRFVERNAMYPVVILCALTRSVPAILCKFGDFFGPLVITICALKLLRFAFSNTPKQHMILAFTFLFFKYDLRWASEGTLIDLFFISIIFVKFSDLYLKMKFVITYIAPWQITWGSAFHAFAQPFSVPHSAMLFLQAGVSALFSTPLNPFLGSAIFITSYVRPVKFWEKDYNTKRVDHSNTRLSQQLERNTGADDNNLNSIFYEHLTRSLQHSLCGDLLMGRWGNAEQGDTFIMASDSLNALVHIIEMGNGLVTFQLRGLEFRGTYCQQREVEAITEGVEENESFCCFEPGHLPHFLSLNAAFNQRWLSWEVVVTKYVLEGYSISDNNAASMVGVFDFRKVLIMYYVQSIIYYTVRSPRLEQWLENSAILEALEPMGEDSYCDVDPTFSVHVDEDYDSQNSGISRKSFCNKNLDWIQYCASRREKNIDSRRDSSLVSLCFALSLLGRRALGTASHNNASASVEFFLYGLHALFKGDFRITSPRDEWVFADMELLRRVVSPGVRMSLKLHQDHFLISDAYETEESLYDAISHYEANLVISHEADPAWRNAVLSNTPSLLALRNVFDEGLDEYKVIMLNKRFLTFRIVKINRECVRGLWAGQQQELIFLRNRNPERGSIQNAKQALRNMINSSCDQPIGYPIYVSPLTTSYSSTNEQYTSVIGGEFIIDNVKRFFKNTWQSLRRHCGASCTSGSSAFVEGDIPYSCTHQAAANILGSGRPCPTSTPTNTPGDVTLNSMGNRGSLVSTTSSAASKPRSLVTLAGMFGDVQQQQQQKDNLPQHKVKIIDTTYVYDNINLGRRIDVQWPNEEWRNNGGKNVWAGWTPAVGMEGTVVHRWSPCHCEIMRRSHTDKTILLVQIGEKYVPVCDLGVQDMGPEIC